MSLPYFSHYSQNYTVPGTVTMPQILAKGRDMKRSYMSNRKVTSDLPTTTGAISSHILRLVFALKSSKSA